MGLFRSMGARKDATRGTTPIEVRKGLAHLFTGSGVLPGADSPLVAGTASWAYSVGKAGFVSTRGASDGVHLFGNDGTITTATVSDTGVTLAAPSAGLKRIDIIYVRQPSNLENADTTSEPVVGVASGTPQAVPVAPAIPTGAVELARNTMTSVATTTASAGNTITQTAAPVDLVAQPLPYLRLRAATARATPPTTTWTDMPMDTVVDAKGRQPWTVTSSPGTDSWTITVSEAGLYAIEASITMSGSGFAARIVSNLTNTLAQTSTSSGASFTQSLSTNQRLAAGASIRVQAYLGSALASEIDTATRPMTVSFTKLSA